MSETLQDQEGTEVNAEAPTPSDVAEEFGKGYYRVLSTKPQEIYKYYKEDSVFTTLSEGVTDIDRLQGPQPIQEKLQSLGLTSYRVLLPVFQAQESITGSILILAKGQFAKRDFPPRPFVQTFLLAPQNPAGWYVKNDVLVFLKEEAPAPAVSNEPKKAEVSSSAHSYQPAPVENKVETVSSPPVVAESKPSPSQNGNAPSAKAESHNRPEPIKKGFGRTAKGKEKEDGEGKPTGPPKTSWATITAANLPTEVGALSAGSRPSGGSPKSSDVVTIRVRNLPFDATDNQVQEVFGQFGTITDIKINRGYCFVEYNSNEGVKNAVDAQNLVMTGRDLQVEEKKPKTVRRGVRADGKRVGMDYNRPARRGGTGNQGKGRNKNF